MATATTTSARTTRVNDVHSELNETIVSEVVRVDSLEALRGAVLRAAVLHQPVAIAGGRHSMGGQQFCAGGMLLDTRGLDRVLALDTERGIVEVEAGIQWPALIHELERLQRGARQTWGIAQKQTGADRLTIGGAIASNVHGRGLAMRPFVSDVESLTLVDARGELVTCSRDENAELFRLVCGGYGLFGCVYSARLRLSPRRVLERVVEVRSMEELPALFEQRIADGFLYGDFQFAIDPASDDFLRTGVFSCYRPVVGDARPAPSQRALTREDWTRLIALAHTDKARAFEVYSAYYLATSGQLYHSDTHQLADYDDGYHARLDAALGAEHRATEMISEVYVPRDRLVDFMADAARDFRTNDIDVVYGTIRLIERDDESFLAWATDRWACVVFNLHTVHTPEGVAHSAAAFRRLIDLAIERGGSYYLTYHRWARRDQMLRCYPQLPDVIASKRRYDPRERFKSDWYRHCVEQVEGGAAS
jgi:FAD/FMN-containing dehydrogenase